MSSMRSRAVAPAPPRSTRPTAVAATPTQLRVATELFARRTRRPRFHRGTGPALRDLLEDGLGPLVTDRRADDPLVLAKRTLAHVETCEGLVVAERAVGFAWSTAAGRGAVAHKAVELSMTLRVCPAPLDLVDLAIERLIDGDRGIRGWLLDLPPAERAELRGAAADWVVKFQDTFPVLQPAWRPRLESLLTVDLCGGRVLLRGKVDLALGRPEGTQARVLIVDFKSGRPQAVHAADLGFYALLETIRVGVPPYRLATFSLDSGAWAAEDVDPGVLGAAARRTVEAAARIVAVDRGGAPKLRPGPACRWCPAAAHCPAAPAASAPRGCADARVALAMPSASRALSMSG